MESVLASGAAGRGFEPRSGQTEEFEIGMLCFSVTEAHGFTIIEDVRAKYWLDHNRCTGNFETIVNLCPRIISN